MIEHHPSGIASQTRRATPDEIAQAVQATLAEACVFFGVSSEWTLQLLWESPPDNAAADISFEPDYFKAKIRVDMDYLQCYPGEVRRVIGHEVAHLMTVELALLRDVFPKDAPNLGTLEYLHQQGIEKTTTRFERLFLRGRDPP